MNAVTFPVPQNAVLSTFLDHFNREELGRTIEILIALLDALDGDADAESPGAEDDFEIPAHALKQADKGAGCTISDPDAAADDVPCDELFQDMEPEETSIPHYDIDQAKGPLPSHLAEDRDLMMTHLQRIRTKRCQKIAVRDPYTGRQSTEYRL
jgi:hypothetical protein